MQTIDPGAPDDPIAWRAIGKDAPVYAVDGALVGHVDELLGSDAEDIFHGIVLSLQLESARRVAIASDDITAITRHGIACSRTSQEIALLPQHTEEHAFTLGWKKASFIYRHLPGQHPDEAVWTEEK
jgi:hypothetical protein